jgi:hypothetical protein
MRTAANPKAIPGVRERQRGARERGARVGSSRVDGAAVGAPRLDDLPVGGIGTAWSDEPAAPPVHRARALL